MGAAILAAMAKVPATQRLDHRSFGGGNISGGLSTIEEKSIGAYTKSGTKPIVGLLKPGVLPARPASTSWTWCPTARPWGYPNINDNAEVVEMIACGAHTVLFSTGCGSVVGSAISPVIKVCANPETFRRMEDDMDVDAGRILEDRGTLDEVAGWRSSTRSRRWPGASPPSPRPWAIRSSSSATSFEPLGPACLPV